MRNRRILVCLSAASSMAVAFAHAALPPLPPLPPAMTDAVSYQDAYDDGEDSDDDDLDRVSDRNSHVAGAADIGERPDADIAETRASVPAREVPSAGLGRTAATPDGLPGQALPGPRQALEGPPVPLAPAERISESHEGRIGARDGKTDDDKPITLHFRQAELADVLEAFARFTGLNIVASEKVRGSVSLHLDNVPWRTAFDTLLDVNGLAMARRGNVIWVAPLAELAARQRQRFESHARAADLEPLSSRTFALRYPRAEDVQRLLTAPGAQRVLSKRGGAMADARTNLLFVTDLDARLAQVADLIAELDKPTRQVLIEARIVEGVRGFSRDLGARLSLYSTSAKADGGGAGAQALGLAGGKDGVVHDLSARALGGFDAATVGLALFAARATRLITTELSALEAQGRGQIVSSPRVVTADRAKAMVEQGTEIPYQARVRNGVGVQFRRATLKLDVEPRITPNGRVILDLEIAKDSVGQETAAGPAIDTKRVQTRVEVEDGGTVSIGGIYETEDRDDVTGVPVLGKIPILGALFRHRAQREQAKELAVFITPRVVELD
ncbi:type IV pilus assembly protein PilQ [Trinickia symbiotica]|uniref:Type IV pilus secretin PilQ n=1 Tax=Trinickia symbiotica TaxID=863227 RepID=A0A2N7WZC1_9BURK|nr:type IV pilus secretin PilQ [Trinickia symbiotica]PMS34672.1 type IV pilus secretin PilQ [Trinickia symbiotica]PPK43367.1 type IV pilus assembly protein PilQ [Trinickia symbiotica]